MQNKTVDDVGGLIRSESLIIQDEENFKTVIRELDYDRKFTKQQAKDHRKDSVSSHPNDQIRINDSSLVPGSSRDTLHYKSVTDANAKQV